MNEPDFAFVDLRLAVEVDGAGKLPYRGAFEAFFEREHRLAAAGWQVVRFTWAQVVRRPPTWPASSANVWGVWPATVVGDTPQRPDLASRRNYYTSSISAV